MARARKLLPGENSMHVLREHRGRVNKRVSGLVMTWPEFGRNSAISEDELYVLLRISKDGLLPR